MISCWRERTVRTPPTPPDAEGEKDEEGEDRLVKDDKTFCSVPHQCDCVKSF